MICISKFGPKKLKYYYFFHRIQHRNSGWKIIQLQILCKERSLSCLHNHRFYYCDWQNFLTFNLKVNHFCLPIHPSYKQWTFDGIYIQKLICISDLLHHLRLMFDKNGTQKEFKYLINIKKKMSGIYPLLYSYTYIHRVGIRR